MATLAQKMKTMVGFCSSCGANIIDLTGEKPKKLPNFREHLIQLSDWSLMRVGVCDICKEKLTNGKDRQKIADAVLNNHKTYWKNTVNKPKGKDALTVLNPDTTDEDFKRERVLKMHRDKKLS